MPSGQLDELEQNIDKEINRMQAEDQAKRRAWILAPADDEADCPPGPEGRNIDDLIRTTRTQNFAEFRAKRSQKRSH